MTTVLTQTKNIPNLAWSGMSLFAEGMHQLPELECWNSIAIQLNECVTLSKHEHFVVPCLCKCELLPPLVQRHRWRWGCWDRRNMRNPTLSYCLLGFLLPFEALRFIFWLHIRLWLLIRWQFIWENNAQALKKTVLHLIHKFYRVYI